MIITLVIKEVQFLRGVFSFKETHTFFQAGIPLNKRSYFKAGDSCGGKLGVQIRHGKVAKGPSGRADVRDFFKFQFKTSAIKFSFYGDRCPRLKPPSPAGESRAITSGN